MSRKFDQIKIVKTGLMVLKRAGIPYYWSKYSRKDYTLHQHIMLIVLAQYVGSVERMQHPQTNGKIVRFLGLFEAKKRFFKNIDELIEWYNYDNYILA